MLGFEGSFLSFSALTLAASALGLVIVSVASRFTKGIYLAGFALGVFFWYFSDTLGDSGYLDVNAGFSGGLVHLGLVALFAIALVSFPLVDRQLIVGKAASWGIPLLIALGVGIHGFGEGVGFGATAASTPTSSILEAFGGVSPVVAYAAHKILEATMVGVAYRLYSGSPGKRTGIPTRDLLFLVAVFCLPAIVGSGLGYVAPVPTDYFFAFATGSGVYVALRLAVPVFKDEETAGRGLLKVASALLVGFLAMYAAALLHS